MFLTLNLTFKLLAEQQFFIKQNCNLEINFENLNQNLSSAAFITCSICLNETKLGKFNSFSNFSGDSVNKNSKK